MIVVATIRNAKHTDCPACQKLGRVPEIAIAPNYFLPLEYYQAIVRGKNIFLVAEIQKKVVGFVIAEKIQSGFLIQYLMVSKRYQRQGIGRTLLETVEREAKKRWVYFLLAYAELKSPGMNKLHKQLGYHSSHVTREWSKGLTK